MYRTVKNGFNYLLAGLPLIGNLERRKSRKKLSLTIYDKLRDTMVAPALASNAVTDFNDPVRKQLLEEKRKHAAQQKTDYSHVFT